MKKKAIRRHHRSRIINSARKLEKSITHGTVERNKVFGRHLGSCSKTHPLSCNCEMCSAHKQRSEISKRRYRWKREAKEEIEQSQLTED